MSNLFINLYDQYYDDIYRYVYLKTGNKWDSEDIVSEIFRKAYENKKRLQDVHNTKAWIMSIARNTVIDFYRKKKNLLVGEDIEFYVGPLPFEDPFENFNELDCLKKSLKQLPKEDLEVINLRYFSNMKFKDIAFVLQKAENSMRVKSNRITKKLSILLKRCLGEI